MVERRLKGKGNMVQTLSIRTKLIMAMLALVGTVALMAVVTADAANAAERPLRVRGT
jgi:hypothetical protein